MHYATVLGHSIPGCSDDGPEEDTFTNFDSSDDSDGPNKKYLKFLLWN